MLFALFMMQNIGHAQTFFYSKWASDQVMHVVASENPSIEHDTIKADILPSRYAYRSTFRYRDFRIEIIKDYSSDKPIKIHCISGMTIVMLRPDDQYAILEKLIPLTR